MLCKSCEEGALIWFDRDDGNGFYLCENWEICSPHSDCALPVDEDIYKKMESEDKAVVDRNITASAGYTNPNKFAKVLKVSLYSAVVRKAFKPPIRRAPVTLQPPGIQPLVLSQPGSPRCHRKKKLNVKGLPRSSRRVCHPRRRGRVGRPGSIQRGPARRG